VKTTYLVESIRKLDLKRIKPTIKGNHFFNIRNIYSKEIVEKENSFKYILIERQYKYKFILSY